MTELIQDSTIKRGKVRISLSTGDSDLSEGLTLAIQKELGDKFDLSFVEHAGVGQLLSYAESTPIDLFILVLNNLMFADTTMFRGTRRWSSLEVVSHLRETYEKPVITLTGSSQGEPSRAEEEAKEAGARFFFWLPYSRRSFVNAVEQCLEQIGPPSTG